MSTMQEFYDKFSSGSQQRDPHWEALTQLAKASPEQISSNSGELGWYWWSTTPPKVS